MKIKSLLKTAVVTMAIGMLAGCGPKTKYIVQWFDADKKTVLYVSDPIPEGETPEYPYDDPAMKVDEEKGVQSLFSGWSPEVKPLTGPTNYVATFNTHKYKITWKNYDGTVLNTEYVLEGETPAYTKGTPVKTAPDGTAQYTFTGWSPAIKPVSEAITYQATFDVSKYLITWKNSDDTILKSEFVAVGQTPSFGEDIPTKTSDDPNVGYEFAGWNPQVKEVNSSATYYATFNEIKKYPITWKNYNGTVLYEEYVAEGKIPAYGGETPTKDFDAHHTYAFAGWNPEVGEVTGAATYTANFEIESNVYTITWKDEKGAVLGSCYVPEGKTPEFPGETPTKAEDNNAVYAFDKWEPALAPATADTTYTASFKVTKNKYLITWKDENGTKLGEKIFYEGETPVFPGENPTKAKDDRHTYAFGGWEPAVVPATAAATYVAKYDVIEERFLVTWKNADGSELAKVFVLKGTTPTYPNTSNPSKEDNPPYVYEFDGWDKTVGPVTADVVYTAKFKEIEKQYKITWNDYDGTPLFDEPDYISYGSPITYDHEDPTRESTVLSDFEFIGWDKDYTKLTATSDTTFTAVYKETKYEGANIAYHFGETKNKISNSNKTLIRVGTDLSLSNASAAGYKFEGWFFDEAYTISAGTKLTNVDHDINLFGKFSLKTYSITYVMNDGELEAGASNPVSITCEDQAIVLANPSKLGHTFIGWSGYTSGKVLDCRLENVTKDLTLTANFKANTYKIVLKYTDRDDSTIEIQYGSTISGLPELTKEGSTFLGWFTKENIPLHNGDLYGYTDQNGVFHPYTVDLVLYPMFSDTLVHTISYELDGGVLPAGYPTSYKAHEYLPSVPNPTKDGYSFTGWTYVDPQSGKDVNFTSFAGLDFDITLTAHWGVREVTINYVYGEGATLKRNLTFVDETSAEIESHEISTFEGAEFISYEDSKTAQFKGWADAKGKMYDFSSDAIVEGDTTLKPVMEPVEAGAIAGKVGEDATATVAGSSTKVIQYTSVSAQVVDFEVTSTAGLKVTVAEKGGKQVGSIGNGTTTSVTLSGVHFEANTTYLVSVEVSGSGDNNITVATTGTVAEGALSGKIYSKAYVTEFTVQHFGETFDNSIVPVKEGYVFDGWFDADGNYYDSYTELTSTVITLYAKWVKA